jgi:Bacterial Ig domain
LSTVSITVTAVNDAPVAAAVSVSTAEDTGVDVVLSGSDLDGDGLSFAVAAGPQHGTLSGSGATRTYAPDPDFNGSDSFTYRVNDGSVDSVLATVSITVTPVNDRPLAVLTAPASGSEGSSIALVAAASDPDGDTLSWTWSISATGLDGGGACSLSSTTGTSVSLSCTDDASVTVTATANDSVLTAEATAVVAVLNANPSVALRPIAPPGTAPALVTVSADVADPGSNDVLSCLVSFGNGSSQSVAPVGGVCTASTTVTNAGTNTATVTVTDDDLGSATASALYTVTAPPPPVEVCRTVTGESRWTTSKGFWKLELEDERAPFDGLTDTIEVDAPNRKHWELPIATVTISAKTATVVSKASTVGVTITAVVVDNGRKGDQFSVEVRDGLGRVIASTLGLHTGSDGFTVSQSPSGPLGCIVLSPPNVVRR